MGLDERLFFKFQRMRGDECQDYLDYVENVPDDIQRTHTRLRELDMIQHQVASLSLNLTPHDLSNV